MYTSAVTVLLVLLFSLSLVWLLHECLLLPACLLGKFYAQPAVHQWPGPTTTVP